MINEITSTSSTEYTFETTKAKQEGDDVTISFPMTSVTEKNTLEEKVTKINMKATEFDDDPVYQVQSHNITTNTKKLGSADDADNPYKGGLTLYKEYGNHAGETIPIKPVRP
jgi:hypothetical protein